MLAYLSDQHRSALIVKPKICELTIVEMLTTSPLCFCYFPLEPEHLQGDVAVVVTGFSGEAIRHSEKVLCIRFRACCMDIWSSLNQVNHFILIFALKQLPTFPAMFRMTVNGKRIFQTASS